MQVFPEIRRVPDEICIRTEAGAHILPGAETVTVKDITLTFRDAEIYLTAGTSAVKEISLHWRAQLPEDTLICADHWERAYGDLCWRAPSPEETLPWYFYACAKGRCALYGVKLRPNAFCGFACGENEIRLLMDVGCGSDGTVLAGRTVLLAKLVQEETKADTAFAAATALLPALCDGGAVFPKQPVYGYNNWYFAYGTSSEAEILASARELAQLTEGLQNRPFLVIDDCWQENRESGFIGGSWRRGNRRFPDMKGLAGQIAALDVLPGIWMRPLQNKAPELPERMYRDKNDFILDPSLPETLDYIAEDVRTLIGWGYKLIKHDYSFYDTIGKWGKDCAVPLCAGGVHFASRTFTTAEILKRLYKTIFDAAAGRALILGCNTVGHLGVGCMELARTGDDTSGRDWERTRVMGVNALAFRMPQHNLFFSADADCVGITPAVPWEKNRQWLDLLANSGTPLFVSVAPGSLDEAQYAELKTAFATAANGCAPAVPRDWVTNRTPELWEFEKGAAVYHW